MSKIYSVMEVSKILRVHYNTVYQLIRTKKLKAIRIGRTIKVSEDQVNEFLNDSLIS